MTLPDLSDATKNPRAMGSTPWGDEAGEKMDSQADAGSDRVPDGDDPEPA